jgi:hypothetical protein
MAADSEAFYPHLNVGGSHILNNISGRASQAIGFLATAVPEFSADGADDRGSFGCPSALIRVISGQISSSVSSAASCKTDPGLVAAPAAPRHPWSICSRFELPKSGRSEN